MTSAETTTDLPEPAITSPAEHARDLLSQAHQMGMTAGECATAASAYATLAVGEQLGANGLQMLSIRLLLRQLGNALPRAEGGAATADEAVDHLVQLVAAVGDAYVGPDPGAPGRQAWARLGHVHQICERWLYDRGVEVPDWQHRAQQAEAAWRDQLIRHAETCPPDLEGCTCFATEEPTP